MRVGRRTVGGRNAQMADKRYLGIDNEASVLHNPKLDSPPAEYAYGHKSERLP